MAGQLLIDRGEHEEVEAAIRRYLDDSPRVQVSALGDGAADPGSSVSLRRSFRSGKLSVVADAAMRKRLAKVRKESWDPSRTDRQRCALGAEIST